MLDTVLLQVVKSREQYEKVARYIQKDSIGKKTMAIVKDIGKYFESTEETEIDFPAFRSLFFNAYHIGLKDDDITYYNNVLTVMEKDAPEAVQKNLINALLEKQLATSVANDIDLYMSGEEIDIVHAIFSEAQQTKDALQRTTSFVKATFEDSSIEEGLSDDVGYDWCLPMLNKTYRKIQAGDATIIAARPGKGKTTFLCQQNLAMARTMPVGKTIVWFNNESRRQKIMSRQIQSALGKTDKELHAMKNDGTLRPAYLEAMGTLGRVEIYDVHGKSNLYVEEILETYGEDGVGAIIFDMLDKLKFKLPQGMREDQRLEALYTWGRELGVKYICPTFPSSQISVEGAGLLFPADHMLKDSKTGKQGACDNILMIGSSEDPMIEHVRGISMPKEKVKRNGQEFLQGEVLFNSDIGRYIEG